MLNKFLRKKERKLGVSESHATVHLNIRLKNPNITVVYLHMQGVWTLGPKPKWTTENDILSLQSYLLVGWPLSYLSIYLSGALIVPQESTA